MTYRVLLVDDEILDLQALEVFIPWNELGYEIVAAVNSGFHALEVIDHEEVDVLITDIHMPNMSGLELARRILEKRNELRVIFISGHKEFNYVKSAISLNAYSYVLKPIDDHELIESLVKIKEEMDLEKKRLEAEYNYAQMIPIVQKEYLQQLFEGTGDPNYVSALFKRENGDKLEWPMYVAAIEPDDLTWKLNQYSSDEKKKLMNEFYHDIFKLCATLEIHYVCKMTNQRIALLMKNKQHCIAMLQTIITHVQANFPFTITGGIGGEAVEPLSLNELYGKAIAALEYKMFSGKGKIIDFKDIQISEKENVYNLENHLDVLFKAMENFELVRIHDELNTLFKFTAYLHSRLTVYNFAMYILLKLDSFLHNLNEDLFKILGMELKNLDIILQFETIDDIHSWLRRQLFSISELLNQKKLNKNDKLIREVIEYIQVNLNNNLTLRNIADYFTFSPNYLGHIFKEQTGKNYSEYVVDMRMEKAGQLLKRSSIKIYEVADMVGYRYLPYFSRQFKETYGMTPNEYRRM